MVRAREPHRENAVEPERLVTFLGDRESYPHPVDRVEVIQTHISWVAMTGDFVYKVKKPVDFGFLDYSTVEKRRHLAQREIELNRRLCSRIYLDIVPIVDTGDRLCFADSTTDGRVVDWAVTMRRLDERRFLSHRLEHGEASAEDVERIAEVLGPFYRDQDPSASVLDNGRPDRVGSVVKGNLDDAGEGVGQVVSPFAYDAIRHFVHRWLESQQDLLWRRVKSREIRDGHGDLRPDHIHLGTDSVCIYDCIEFNDSFRYVDVAADCAFLAMELDLAGRPDLSRHFVRSMARRLDDPEIHRLMDLYECHRAMVRVRVELLRAQEKEVAPPQREASLERARRYARLALGYALFPARPSVLVVMGRIGTGKSSVARGLADALGWPVLSSDRTRKRLAGLPLHERPSRRERDALYRREVSERVYDLLLEDALKHAARGESVILDATFGRRDDRHRLRERLDREGVSRVLVELTASDDAVRGRLEDREAEPNVVSDARAEDFAGLSAAYEPLSEPERDGAVSIDAGGPLDRTLRDSCLKLVNHRRDLA